MFIRRLGKPAFVCLSVGALLNGCSAVPATSPAASDPSAPSQMTVIPTAGQPLAADARLERIVFGSCAREDRAQDIWDAIVAADPDLFLFIGDNVYVDIPDVPTGPEDFGMAYAELAAKPGWQRLKQHAPVLATWDDHDYGLNDAGREWALRDTAKQFFMAFFDIPADAPMRKHEGIYQAQTVGPENARVQIILLDTRSFRDPLEPNPQGRPPHPDGTGRLGPYIPADDATRTLLGEEQWAWLAAQLQQPADLRIIASSIQVVAYEHGWESWGNFPHERKRLFDLIATQNAQGVVFISGDRHLIELSRDDSADAPYPMWDFTSSGFNWGDGQVHEPNRYRVGPVLREPNFGVLHLDWDTTPPKVHLEGRNGAGEPLMDQSIPLSQLRRR